MKRVGPLFRERTTETTSFTVSPASASHLVPVLRPTTNTLKKEISLSQPTIARMMEAPIPRKRKSSITAFPTATKTATAPTLTATRPEENISVPRKNQKTGSTLDISRIPRKKKSKVSDENAPLNTTPISRKTEKGTDSDFHAHHQQRAEYEISFCAGKHLGFYTVSIPSKQGEKPSCCQIHSLCPSGQQYQDLRLQVGTTILRVQLMLGDTVASSSLTIDNHADLQKFFFEHQTASAGCCSFFKITFLNTVKVKVGVPRHAKGDWDEYGKWRGKALSGWDGRCCPTIAATKNKQAVAAFYEAAAKDTTVSNCDEVQKSALLVDRVRNGELRQLLYQSRLVLERRSSPEVVTRSAIRLVLQPNVRYYVRKSLPTQWFEPEQPYEEKARATCSDADKKVERSQIRHDLAPVLKESNMYRYLVQAAPVQVSTSEDDPATIEEAPIQASTSDAIETREDEEDALVIVEGTPVAALEEKAPVHGEPPMEVSWSETIEDEPSIELAPMEAFPASKEDASAVSKVAPMQFTASEVVDDSPAYGYALMEASRLDAVEAETEDSRIATVSELSIADADSAKNSTQESIVNESDDADGKEQGPNDVVEDTFVLDKESASKLPDGWNRYQIAVEKVDLIELRGSMEVLPGSELVGYISCVNEEKGTMSPLGDLPRRPLSQEVAYGRNKLYKMNFYASLAPKQTLRISLYLKYREQQVTFLGTAGCSMSDVQEKCARAYISGSCSRMGLDAQGPNLEVARVWIRVRRLGPHADDAPHLPVTDTSMDSCMLQSTESSIVCFGSDRRAKHSRCELKSAIASVELGLKIPGMPL